MKKGIAAISAVTMAAVMCVGLVACGDSKSEAEKIVSEEVTQAEWEAAFAEENFANCKLVLTTIYAYKGTITEARESSSGGTIINGQVSEAKQTITSTYIQDGAMVRCNLKAVSKGGADLMIPDGESEYYWADGNRYTVTKKGVTVEEGVEMVTIYSMVPNISDKYQYFEYSKEAKGYVYKQGAPNSNEYFGSGIFKFQNGKLAACIFSDTETYDEGMESVTETFVFTYGGQTVTLPKV